MHLLLTRLPYFPTPLRLRDCWPSIKCSFASHSLHCRLQTMLVLPYLLFYHLGNFLKASLQLKKYQVLRLSRMFDLTLDLNHKFSDLVFLGNLMLLTVCNLVHKEQSSSICYDRNKCTTNQKLIHFVLLNQGRDPALQFSKSLSLHLLNTLFLRPFLCFLKTMKQELLHQEVCRQQQI